MLDRFKAMFLNEEEYEEEYEQVAPKEEKEEKRELPKKEKTVSRPINNVPTTKNNVVLTEPLVFADSKDILDDIKKNKVVIINLNKLDLQTADRLLDFISGGIYALGARLKTIGDDIYLCVPSGVEVTGDFSEGDY